jgi:hypothetical protein
MLDLLESADHAKQAPPGMADQLDDALGLQAI